ncbi:MAG TPA: RHS repeat-associated core domain-containing protein [Acidobacteriaceae bacterium]|jgi:RHS repeat-associated protein
MTQTTSCTTTFHVCAFAYLFTGKERDAESGLDYFGARYYASTMGRFMSPDDGSDQEPNNPLINTDPDGHDCINASNASSGTASIITTNNSGDCGKGFTYVNGTINASSLTYNSGTGVLSFNTSNYADGSGMAATNVMQLGNTADSDTLRAGVFQGNAARWNNAAGTIGPMAGYEMGAILMLMDPLLSGTLPEVSLDYGGVGTGQAGRIPLNGKTRPEAREALQNAGFKQKGATQGGYETWQHPDGSKVTIGPDGGIDRIPPSSSGKAGGTTATVT